MSGITPAPPRDRHGIAIQGLQTTALVEGWELAQSAPGEHDHRLVGCGALIPARAPGTVGSALVAAGADPDSLGDLDADDWWFRHRFASRAGGGREKTVLRLDGLATIAEVWLNGTQVLASDNMFRRHVIPVDDLLEEENELVLGFRALAPLLVDRKPRPRWRTRVVQHQALRRHRTTIFGRAAGFAPGPAPVGPWRLVALERSTTFVVDQALIRPSLERNRGVLRVKLVLRAVSGRHPESARVALDGPTGSTSATLAVRAEGPSIVVEGTAEIPHVQPWWPHTHGDPATYRVLVTLSEQQEETTLDAGEVGFRSIDVDDPDGGFALRINGASVFCRGGALTPDRLELDRSEVELRALLTRVRDAGMNMIRLSGIGVYGDDLLYRLCDELGLLVWQDFAFANMDYPTDDAEFSASVEAEAAGFLEPAGRHASLAVLCGGSEVEQQAAMMGIPPPLEPNALFELLLPAAIGTAELCTPYLRSTPTGGSLPIKPNAGVAHYYGVGAYRRPLEDARRAEVRFAAECLAFSNVPCREALAELGAGAGLVQLPAWKQGVPRDSGASWDFEDVRDHYLQEVYGVEPTSLRTGDSERYLALSQAATGLVMAETLGEWRRAGSPCAGALIWWLNDVLPGAGWGILDSRGRPKPAYWIARRSLAPLAVWTTDEGTNGIAVHIANDTSDEVNAVVDVRLLRNSEQVVAHGERAIRLGPRVTIEDDVESILGRFVDAGYAYRFGSPQHDVVAVTLLSEGRIVSQTARFPLGREPLPEPAPHLGITAIAEADGVGGFTVELTTRRVAEGVCVSAPDLVADDAWLLLIPGFRHKLRLQPVGTGQDGEWRGGRIDVLGGGGSIAISSTAG